MSEGLENQPTESLDWGYQIPALAAERIRINVPIIGGLDEAKVLKGHVLDRILGDDVGVFGTAALWFDSKMLNVQEAVAHRTIFLNRLKWEAEQPQTPQEIKTAIAILRKKTEGIFWDKEENVKMTRALWQEHVFNRMQTMYRSNEEGVSDAIKEYRRYEEGVSEKNLDK